MNTDRLYAFLFRACGFRTQRMKVFKRLMAPTESTTILDAGGLLSTWTLEDIRPQITLLNLDASQDRLDYPDHVRFIQGDALTMTFADRQFDIVFSNSLIEHVGNWENQQEVATQLRRVAKKVFIQTPAREFFFEPHLLTPFIHWLPREWQRCLLRNFTVWGLIQRPSFEAASEFFDHLRPLSRKEMDKLFPDCTIREEKWFWMTKAYIAYRV